MTVASATSSASYTGNGSTTAFAIPFYFLQNTDVVVQTIAADGTTTTAVLDSDYSLTGAGNEAGGTATFGTAPADGVKVYIARVVTIDQETAYPQDTPFPAASHEQALDKLTMIAQQLQRAINAALQYSTAAQVAGASNALPDPVANMLLAWNANANGLQNVSAPDAASGSYAPGYAGAVANALVADKLRSTVDAKVDFGAVGDGMTDDTAAIQAALTYCALSDVPRTLHLPAGTYKVTSGFTIQHPVRIVGEGEGAAAFESAVAEVGTKIVYAGTAGATVFEFLDINFGNGGIEGIWIDCNNLADNGVVIDGCMGSRFAGLKIDNFAVCGMKLTGTTNTCSWNTFERLAFNTGTQTSGTKGALWLSGVTGGANACHNTFVNIIINHSGSFHGIYLGGCDNNTFITTYIFQNAGGTGHGVHCDFSENGVASAFPEGNIFVHLESMAGYYEAAASPARGPTSAPSSIIYGYQRDNGEVLPTLVDGAPLPRVDNAGNMTDFQRHDKSQTVVAGTTIATRAADTIFLAYTAATSVTDLTGAQIGDIVHLYMNFGTSAVTLKNSAGTAGTEMFLKGGVDVTLGNSQCVTLLLANSSGWTEIGRNF